MDFSADSRINGSLNTDFLKIIALITMLIDHIGAILLPGEIWMRVVGRISWPLFAYCLVVGFLYTHSLKKYVLRLALFAALSEPFYLAAFHPESLSRLADPLLWRENFFSAAGFFHLNIFFTMLLGLAALWGIREKKYWATAGALLVALLPIVSYGPTGVALIIFIYLFREFRPLRSASLLALLLASDFLLGPRWFPVAGFEINIQGFSVLAVPLMFWRTNFPFKLNKYFFYVFYPAHLALLLLIKSIM